MIFSQQAHQAIKILDGIVVRHPSFNDAVEIIENFMQVGNESGIHTGARLIAPSGVGKSLLLQHLINFDSHTNPYNLNPRIISTSLKENPSVSQLQGDLLRLFGYPLQGISRNSNNNDVNQILVRAIIENKVKLLGLDEFQHIFLNGGLKVATVVIDWLKRLMNSTNIPVLLMGTEMLDRLGSVDAQLTSRVPTVIKLNRFQFNKEWLVFLQTLAVQFKEFDLTLLAKDYGRSLYLATGGSLRLLKTLLAYAIGIGISKHETAISQELLVIAYRNMFGQVKLEENPFVDK